MKNIKKNYLKKYITNSQFYTFYNYRIKKITYAIFKFYIPIILILILLFSCLYYFSNGLKFLEKSNHTITFFDCIYFSTVTFFTVGFGDIQPYTILAKISVIAQNLISFIILALFSGYIVAIFFVRRNDVFFDNKLVVRHNKENFVLTFPIMNKGPMFYDMNSSFSFSFTKTNNVNSRFSLISLYTTWFKKRWLCDIDIKKINLKDKNYKILYEILYMIISNQLYKIENPKFKISIHGIDSQTRGIAYYIKEYHLKGMDLILIEDYLNFFDKKNKPQYSNFGKFNMLMSDDKYKDFMCLLQQIIFPINNIKETISETNLYYIENAHINEIMEEPKKIIKM